jgi:integrase
MTMAKVRQRTWTVPGQRTKRKAWGFVTIENGKQVRHFKAEWTKEDAEEALAQCLLKVEPNKPVSGLTFGQAVERYLAAKARKRSRDEDARIFEHLKAELGADTPLVQLTASRISEYKSKRLSTSSVRTKRELTAAGVNRPLAALRHLLRIAQREWEVLQSVPTITLEKEPEGRIRWLEPDEEQRLLAACGASRAKHLLPVVSMALETGLRKSELLGLSWDRVDLSRGVIRLEVTKSGRRREVPMRQAVYSILADLPGPREGRVWPSGAIRSAFETAVETAKLDDFHFHDCRHHFASWFVMRGGSLQALKTILGHADIKMTLRYAHLSPDHLRGEIARTERPAQSIGEITQGITHEPDKAAQVPQN